MTAVTVPETDHLASYMTDCIAQRLGASDALRDPTLMKQRTLALDIMNKQFLAVAAKHVQQQMEFDDPDLSPRVAVALAMNGTARAEYLRDIVGREQHDRCEMTLKYIESLMNPQQRLLLQSEICYAVGTVH